MTKGRTSMPVSAIVMLVLTSTVLLGGIAVCLKIALTGNSSHPRDTRAHDDTL